MQDDAKDGLTPAESRRRRRSGLIVFGLFLLAVLAGLGAIVLTVNDGRNYRRLAQKLGLPQVAAPAQSVLKGVRLNQPKPAPPQSVYPAWLLKAGIEVEAAFERPAARSPQERCTALKIGDGVEPSFVPDGQNWECVLFQEFGSSSEPASLFVQIRGSSADAIRTFRLKLSLIDPATAEAVTREAIATFERFGLTMTAETRTYIRDMLESRREFSSIVENYRMSYSQEMSDERRYNLLLVPRAPTTGCGDAPQEERPGTATTPAYPRPVGCLPLRDIQEKAPR
jgi:hypothetical protein